jgi:putative flavoprotein involved in K+ transport
MDEPIETLIIGAGPSGLVLSRELQRTGREHVVLERGRVGERWRSERWDSLTMLTPNWMNRLPGEPERSEDPNGFEHRNDFVARLESYAAHLSAIRAGVEVIAVHRGVDDYFVETAREPLRARNVIVATGPGQQAVLPPAAADIVPGVLQLHSSHYRNPSQLPSGTVLVVGSGSSGLQIAEELMLAGRRVYLSLGAVERPPRRYRGRDIYAWADCMGALDLPWGDDHETREGGHPPSPAISGVDGGGEIDPHALARHGVVLLGGVQAARGEKIFFAGDAARTLAAADASAARWREVIDDFIRRKGIRAPEDPYEPAAPGTGENAVGRHDVDVRADGVSSIVWATGFRSAFDWVHAPVFHGGHVLTNRGVTSCPGLYFLRTHPHRRKSTLLYGLPDEVQFVADHLAGSCACTRSSERDRSGGAAASRRGGA